MARPSVYLVDKCRNLKTVVEFFLSNSGGYCRTANEKRAVFLSQLDFWDWEMDELIYAVDSFRERSKNWDSVPTLTAAVSRLGISLRGGLVQDIHYKRLYRVDDAKKTVAPLDALNAVIKKWNQLLDLCEKQVMLSKRSLEGAVYMGAQLLANLDKYRKQEKPKEPS